MNDSAAHQRVVSAFALVGARNLELYIGNSGMSDAGVKESRQAEIRQRFGPTVAAIDDRLANRQAIIRGAVFTRPSACSSVKPFHTPKRPSLYALGTMTTSGAVQPRSSAISYAIVL